MNVNSKTEAWVRLRIWSNVFFFINWWNVFVFIVSPVVSWYGRRTNTGRNKKIGGWSSPRTRLASPNEPVERSYSHIGRHWNVGVANLISISNESLKFYYIHSTVSLFIIHIVKLASNISLVSFRFGNSESRNLHRHNLKPYYKFVHKT